MSHYNNEVRRYIVGIQYTTREEDRGYFDIERTVTLSALALEVHIYLMNGKSSYPAYSSEARAELIYAWDLDAVEDGDCYPELMDELNKIQCHNTGRR